MVKVVRMGREVLKKLMVRLWRREKEQKMEWEVLMDLEGLLESLVKMERVMWMERKVLGEMEGLMVKVVRMGREVLKKLMVRLWRREKEEGVAEADMGAALVEAKEE